MTMRILEARIIYDNENISKVTVLADFTSVGESFSDIRALEATTKQYAGYEYIKPEEGITNDLINRVADYGMEVNPDRYFPDWKMKYNSSKTKKSKL